MKENKKDNDYSPEKIALLAIVIVMIVIILFSYLSPSVDVYDDGLVTDKYIKHNKFLFVFNWDTYHLVLDGDMDAERTVQVEEDIYMTMREGYEYTYFWFSHSGNTT